ncbi:MAG: tetratricopeptide repeat protein [Candidatus Omnitrophota bacterium]
MKKITLAVLAIVLAATAFAAEPANFDDELARIAHADSDAAIMKITEEAIAKCAAAADFEKLALSIKNFVSEKSDFKYSNALYYAIAKTRIDELTFLSQKNDIESGRLYMSLNESYRIEAADYIDKVLGNAKSKDLALDAYLLKFLTIKDEFQPQRTEAFLDEMADRIAKYSDDGALNRRQLSRIAGELTDKGSGNYAMKLRISYAQKVDPKSAQEVLEDIRRDGDKSFAQGNMRGAAALYDTYINSAQSYFNKEAMGAKVMEIAERYFGSNRYRDARKYYELFAQGYPDSKVIDYCKYKTALCYCYEKDYANAVANLESFLGTYQNSVWFDRAFETLCRIYFGEFPKEKAAAGLQKLIDNYYRKNIGDYAYLLLGALYYSDKEYDKAAEYLKKVDINSVYSYAAEILSADIKDIKNGSNPSYSFGGKDKYRMWEPGKPSKIDMVPMAAGDASAWIKGGGKGEDKKLEVTYNEAGAAQITVPPGTKVKFALSTLIDDDRFAEYLQDKEDLSRLPKKVKDEDEKDFIALQWKSEGGRFVDERQTRDKIWQAPDEPGAYKISVLADDLGLVRTPDKGVRKDPAKEVAIIVNVVKS